ncbi:uncharacterized protein LOC144663749 isoform X2 [Oculina patagonica]
MARRNKDKALKCNRSSLSYHNRSYHSDMPHKCSQCSKGFKDDSGLKRHRCKKISLEDREKYTCWMCGEFCHNVCGILYHMYKHGMRKD